MCAQAERVRERQLCVVAGPDVRSYRREYWNQQPVRVEVWSEKGTVRGVLQPVRDEFGIAFRVVHGPSATIVHDVVVDYDAAIWSCCMSATGT
jgi:hypothetical protein